VTGVPGSGGCSLTGLLTAVGDQSQAMLITFIAFSIFLTGHFGPPEYKILRLLFAFVIKMDLIITGMQICFIDF
jgi:hypothetical protein